MTYEYVCGACGHQWEAEQSIKDRPLKDCVACGADKAKRLVSGGTGFVLKGGGWYADLYGSPGAGASKAGGDDKAGKAAASGTKADTAPAKTDSAKTDSGKAAASGTSGSSSPSSSASTAAPAVSAKAS